MHGRGSLPDSDGGFHVRCSVASCRTVAVLCALLARMADVTDSMLLVFIVPSSALGFRPAPAARSSPVNSSLQVGGISRRMFFWACFVAFCKARRSYQRVPISFLSACLSRCCLEWKGFQTRMRPRWGRRLIPCIRRRRVAF